MSAKFIAQIETGMIFVVRYSDPAAAISPTIVSINGRPAATSDPNATSRISSVTGHEITSDFSIAERFAALKSDHIAAAPVRWTCTPAADSAASLPFRRSAATTIALASRAAPACTIAVCPSREMDWPAVGGMTVLTAPSARSVRSTFAIVAWNDGLLTVLVGE